MITDAKLIATGKPHEEVVEDTKPAPEAAAGAKTEGDEPAGPSKIAQAAGDAIKKKMGAKVDSMQKEMDELKEKISGLESAKAAPKPVEEKKAETPKPAEAAPAPEVDPPKPKSKEEKDNA